MKLSYLLRFICEMNAAIDTGKYQDIPMAEVEEHIERGDLLPYLEHRLGDDVDLSLFIPVKDLGVPDDVDDGKQYIKSQVQLSQLSAKTGKELIDSLQRLHNVGAGVEK